MKKYDFYADPGHGWLKVKRQELIELGIEGEISAYSYQRGDYVYLEEDADAPLFQDAWEEEHQEKFMNKWIRYHQADYDSRIRQYEPFKPEG